MVDAEIETRWAEIGPTEPPPTLYHYTTATGLNGIVTSGQIFLTDAFFLNDKSELNYGRDLVLEVLSARAKESFGDLQTFFTTATDSFHPFSDGPHQIAYYVASLCENGNLLSQWRAYGGGGAGYALGIASEPLRNVSTLLVEHVPPAVLHRIEYDRSKQRQLVEFVVDRCAALLQMDLQSATPGFERKVLLAGWFGVLAVQLTGLFPQFKHPMFSEEREWRLTLSRMPSEENGLLAFREAGNDIIPYIPFCFRLRDGGLLPLHEIVLAPASEPELRRRALSKFLGERGYPPDRVKLMGSEIPLRVRP